MVSEWWEMEEERREKMWWVCPGEGTPPADMVMEDKFVETR